MVKVEGRRVPAVRAGPVVILAAVLAAGCLDTPRPSPGQVSAQGVTVAVQPTTAAVSANGQQLFVATVTGTADTAVTWQIQESGCGAVTAGGTYSAPPAAATCHVVATSHADPTRSAASLVTVLAPPPPPPPPPPVVVTVTPGSASAFGCQTASFQATVTGTANTAVTWSVAEAGGGTVTAAGVYTAPSVDGTYHLVATSVADPTASASAPIVVATKVLSISVSPATITVPPGGSAQLTATVTTTCGTTATLARFQAPADGSVY